MPDLENVLRHKRLHDAFAAADPAGLTAAIAERVRWHVAGRSPVAGTHEGRDAVLAFFGGVQQQTGGSLVLTNHRFMGSEDLTVALFDMTATRGGRALSVQMTEIICWVDGQCAEHWGSAFDQYAYDEFWG